MPLKIDPLPQCLVEMDYEKVGNTRYVNLEQEQIDAACAYVGDMTTVESQYRALLVVWRMALAKGDSKEAAAVVARAESLTQPGSVRNLPPPAPVPGKEAEASPEMARIVKSVQAGATTLSDKATRQESEPNDDGFAFPAEGAFGVVGGLCEAEGQEGKTCPVCAAPCATAVA